MTGTRLRGLLCALAVAAAAAACSSGGSSVHSARTVPSSEPPVEPTTVNAAPATTATYRELSQALIKVTDADGMVAVGGALWIKTDNGRAVQIDPATNKVTAQVRLDKVSDRSNFCQGIGTDGSRLWACAAEDAGTALAQLDPADGHVVRRVQVDKVFDQLSLPATAAGVWALAGDGSTATVVDVITGHPTSYPLGVACQQLAAEGDRLAATSSIANVLVVVDAMDGSVVGRIALQGPRIAAVLDGDVWVDTDAGLTRIGPDLAVHAVYPDVIASAQGDVVAAAGSIWVRSGDGTITRIDPSTGQIAQRITPDSPLTPGSLYIAYDSIWTTSSDAGTVVRLRLKS